MNNDSLDFISLVLETLQKQATEYKDGTGHPDASIARFNRAFLNLINTRSQVRDFILDIHRQRPDLDANHLVILLARATQYVLREQNITDYTQFSETTWEKYVIPLITSSTEFRYLLLTQNNANTKPRLRYRGLSALLALIKDEHVNIIDWGCSMNLGLGGLMDPRYIEEELFHQPMTDNSEGRQVTALIKGIKPTIQIGVGIDIYDYAQVQEYKWVQACAYFEDYEKSRQELETDLARLEKFSDRIKQVVGSVCDADVTDQILGLLKSRAATRRVVHASLVMYQMDSKHQLQALEQVKRVLADGDMLVELTPASKKDWFARHNIVTTVRFMNNGELSKPYDFLYWSSTRCQHVWLGCDFEHICDTILHTKAEPGKLHNHNSITL